LLHALAGLVPAEPLRVVVEGETLVDTARGTAPPAHRRRVGLVFQDHRLFPHLAVAENLRFGIGKGGNTAALGEVVELLELGELLTRRPSDLSGGEQQRVAIGRALLAGPRLLLLDEPLASLDRGLVRQILPYLRRVQDRFGLPMLVVSHDLGDLLTLTDDLVLLDRGRVRGQGTVERLVSEVETLELLHDQGLVFALPGQVERRDPDGLAWVALEGRPPIEIACGDCREQVGAPVDVLLRPEDVVLARPPLDARLSLTNRFPGRVRHITRGERRSLVTLDCGLEAPLLAEVTDRAVRRLELAPGEAVIALAKAQATRTRGAG
ncbi:MAG: ATP-binding cassette domain-containing protein, partial [Planctomycetota bacterium]